MVELRSIPTPKSPRGKLDAMWNPDDNTFIIRDNRLHVDRIYHLHEDGTYDLEEIPIVKAA